MRSYPRTAFVNQFNFKNATAFFTNAFKRKAALNKGSLFSYFVLVNPLEAARCKGVSPLSSVDLSALSPLTTSLPSWLKIAPTRVLTSSTFPSFTTTCSAVPLLSLILILWYSLQFLYAGITYSHLPSNTHPLNSEIWSPLVTSLVPSIIVDDS